MCGVILQYLFNVMENKGLKKEEASSLFSDNSSCWKKILYEPN